jgi:hypothetical protein
MNRCAFCRRSMGAPETMSCGARKHIAYPDGTRLPALPYTQDCLRPYAYPAPERCRDCGVAHGGTHHPPCCLEDCPRCGGQLISCECFDDSEAQYYQRFRPSRGPARGENDLTRALRDPLIRHGRS